MVETQLKILVYARPDSDQENELGYKLEAVSPSHKWLMHDEDIFLEEKEVYVNLPNFGRSELAQKAINTLREKQEHAIAKAQMEKARLEKIIQKLLLLPYVSDFTPEPVVFEDETVIDDDDNGIPF